MEWLFIILFVLCLIFHIIRTVYSVLKSKKLINADNKFLFTFILIDMLLLWITWFQMCENDPAKFNVPEFLRYTGLIIFVTGLLLFIISLFQLKGIENIDHLVTNGIFSVIRHPMYLGMIFWVIGYPLFLGSQYTLFSSVIWIANILYWRYLEEEELSKKFSQYKSYKMNTIF